MIVKTKVSSSAAGPFLSNSHFCKVGLVYWKPPEIRYEHITIKPKICKVVFDGIFNNSWTIKLIFFWWELFLGPKINLDQRNLDIANRKPAKIGKNRIIRILLRLLYINSLWYYMCYYFRFLAANAICFFSAIIVNFPQKIKSTTFYCSHRTMFD